MDSLFFRRNLKKEKENSLEIENVCCQPLPKVLPKRPVSFDYGK